MTTTQIPSTPTPSVPVPDRDHTAEQIAQDPEACVLDIVTIQAFNTHIPQEPSALCVICGQEWPCEVSRRAFRLREGI
ncbi:MULTISPECIES: hypothetical protein [unclassified Crossiella]|uniref:hypothetical protein n=1 Tax=unclassified Crossiella TaxID=2620835 RepID=UPI001FFFC053|nr:MULTISPECIES: hypothetical protein [unclassified Crossiella]MCK2245457.1 hypothetical protein [Crossiella sp. S99.2]MCK2259109.1 hypothetical protein [Crossiella sp. S99.1]